MNQLTESDKRIMGSLFKLFFDKKVSTVTDLARKSGVDRKTVYRCIEKVRNV